jgi:hypothetical protein
MASFQLAHLQSQSIPRVIEHEVAAEQQFLRGAPLAFDNAGKFIEATPDEYGAFDSIVAIALTRYGVDGLVPFEGTPSFDILGGMGFPPGRMQGIAAPQGNPALIFSAPFLGTVPSQVGGSYGIVRGDDMVWRVNFNDTDNATVRLESIDWNQDPINKARVNVSFLPAEGV